MIDSFELLSKNSFAGVDEVFLLSFHFIFTWYNVVFFIFLIKVLCLNNLSLQSEQNNINFWDNYLAWFCYRFYEEASFFFLGKGVGWIRRVWFDFCEIVSDF